MARLNVELSSRRRRVLTGAHAWYLAYGGYPFPPSEVLPQTWREKLLWLMGKFDNGNEKWQRTHKI